MMDELLLRSFFEGRAVRDPEKTAVTEYDTGRSYSFADIRHRALCAANYLISVLGVCKGDRIGICARNGEWFIDLLHAMPAAGCMLATYNCRLRKEELMDLLEDERPAVLLYESCYSEKAAYFREYLPDMKLVVLDGEDPLADLRYGEMLACGEWRGNWGSTDPEDIIMLSHTGGTTGLPKAAMISCRSLFFNTLNQVIDHNTTAGDTLYVSFPLFHMAGWIMALSVLQSGGRIILNRQFSPETTLKLIGSEKLTIVSGSPTVFRRMMESELFEKTDFSGVRSIRCGAASPSVPLMEQYWDKGPVFLNGYGMTEAGSGILSFSLGSTTREMLKEKAGSAGRPMHFVELRIVDEEGKDVPDGAAGELLIHSAQMFSGYWNKPEETAGVLEGGWLHSGDMAYRDKDGFYYICGRKKHMFVTKGENIYPIEIENRLFEFPEVRDAYVFGVPDRESGEVGKALVVLKEGATVSPAELVERLRQELSTIKVPRYIQIIEKIPRNEAGKVAAGQILALYGGANNKDR